jgi:tetratricopeptide (TPR) repeat protein
MGLFVRDKGDNQSPVEIEKMVDEALAEMKKENYPAAIKIYEKIMPDYPFNGVFRNNLACCFAGLGKFDEAETEFVEAIRIFRVDREKGIPVPRSNLRAANRNIIRLYKAILSKKEIVPGASRPRDDRNSQNPFSLKRTIRSIVRGIRRGGVVFIITRIPVFFSLKCNPVIQWYEKVFALRAEEFDRKNNIDTAGIIYQSDIRMDNKNQTYATCYQGSDILLFNNALSPLKINFRDYTFIDFGSGKGKALFLASAYSFGKIIGVEFSEALTAVAQDNIRRFNKDNIQAFCMDAVDYEFPAGPFVCYFYDPFDGCIMSKVIGNIRKAYDIHRPNIVIVYGNPRLHDLFDNEDWLKRIHHIGPYMIWSSNRNQS